MPDYRVIENVPIENVTMHQQRSELFEFMKTMMSLSNNLQQRMHDVIKLSNDHHIYFSPKVTAENNDANFFDAFDDRQVQLKDAHFRYELSLLHQLSSDLDYMVNHFYLQVSTKQDVLLTHPHHILKSLSNRRKLRESYSKNVLSTTANYQCV